MVIVVVGEIEKSELEQKIKNLLSPIPQGVPFNLKKEVFLPAENSFSAVKKDFATNYIQAVSGAPAPGTADYNAFVLAMRIFSDRQFLDVRTNHGLSYAPYSYFDGGLSPTANIFVSTTEPNKYIAVMNDLINRTRKEGFTEEEVKNMKNYYITNFYYRLETNAAQASSLAANEVLHNNWRRSLTLNEDMKNLTRDDLNRVFNKYVNRFAWVYQGDPAKVDQVLYTGAKQDTKIKSPASKVSSQKKN
jgi:predicted Zn-dependent peptidase